MGEISKKGIFISLLATMLATPAGMCPAATVSGTLPASWITDGGQPADGFWRLPLAPRPLPLQKPALVVLLPRQAVPQVAVVDKVTVVLDSVSLSPSLVLVRVGQKLQLANNSGITLACQARGSTSFSTGQIKSGGHFEQVIDHPGSFELSCSGLPAGQATVVTVASSFAVPVDSTGKFTLVGVPKGDYQLKSFIGNTWKDQRPLHVAGANIHVDFEQPSIASSAASPSSIPATKPTVVVKKSARPAATAKPSPKPAATTKPAPKPAAAAKPSPKPAAAAKPSPKPAATAKPAAQKTTGGEKAKPQAAPSKPAPAAKKPDQSAPSQAKPVFKDVQPEIEIEDE